MLAPKMPCLVFAGACRIVLRMSKLTRTNASTTLEPGKTLRCCSRHMSGTNSMFEAQVTMRTGVQALPPRPLALN